ncbi:MAG: glutamate-1-semialdehyde 2,1-aminomutase [Candidatus Eremiobacteraeota bacterium]|nr:glutamate-1-semialdehyde 2,1-aminomutase [Candidatus Eremiobacteraeota bacterium]MBV8722356.1 glutamate-1-semialdehyde 2,1-aminomutase [Candidatus Eremiobacteraeota bacterium]
MQSLSGTERRARGVLAGGCDSPVRSGWGVGAPMFVQSSARGAYAFDEDGRRYVDYVMAYGPLLFGHTHPALVAGLDDLARHGFVWGSTHAEEVRLAERVRRHLPSMQRMRFVTTGTEAMMSAIRVARAFTRRNRVLKFAGNYHGHFDLALLDAGASAHTTDSAASGIPGGVVRDVAVVRYNDLGSVDAFLREHADEVAAIAVEPIVANMGYVAPQPGFLEGLRERAYRCGALLIFDEVITWLRFGLSGAQGRAAVAPDLTALGKIMGGGTPIAAFGGREDVMGVLAPDGAAFTGGTHGGNPFCVGMAHRVLDLLESHPEYYAYLDSLARRLADGIRAIFTERNLPYAVVQRESIVDFKFRAGAANRNYDDALAADKAAYARYYREMLDRGILLPPSQNEVMFVSTAHTEEDVNATLDAIAQSVDS